MALLYDEAFIIDSSEVLTLIMSFIAGNAKIQPRVSNVDGRMAFKALVVRYEGLGLHSVDIIKSDEVIDSLYYAVEKKPHKWWEEFENNSRQHLLPTKKRKMASLLRQNETENFN